MISSWPKIDIHRNKGEVPAQMVDSRCKAVESSTFGFQRDITLVSYVPKKNRSILLISSFHLVDEIVPVKKRKPRMIVDYNKRKGGVDTLDQLVRCYTSKRKCRRWPFTMFCNLVDIAAYNAFVLFLAVHPNYNNNASHKRRKFLIELSKSLLPNVTDCDEPSKGRSHIIVLVCTSYP